MKQTGPVFDPNRPRHLERAQARDRRFYDPLERIVLGGIEALFAEAADAKRDGYRLPPNDIGYRGKR